MNNYNNEDVPDVTQYLMQEWHKKEVAKAAEKAAAVGEESAQESTEDDIIE